MTQFQEDMLFKGVNEKDAGTFIEILGLKSKTVKIWTQELTIFDPSTYNPDIILELDDEIALIELQSIRVRNRHHNRFFVYLQ